MDDLNKFEKVGVMGGGCRNGQHSMDTSKPRMFMNGSNVMIGLTCLDCGTEITRVLPGFPVNENDKKAMSISSGEPQQQPTQVEQQVTQAPQQAQPAPRTEMPNMPFGAPPWARIVMDRYDSEKPNDDFWADVKNKIKG